VALLYTKQSMDTVELICIIPNIRILYVACTYSSTYGAFVLVGNRPRGTHLGREFAAIHAPSLDWESSFRSGPLLQWHVCKRER
jgi:hypothetical protein